MPQQENGVDNMCWNTIRGDKVCIKIKHLKEEDKFI